jgi:hypothetical protein
MCDRHRTSSAMAERLWGSSTGAQCFASEEAIHQVTDPSCRPQGASARARCSSRLRSRGRSNRAASAGCVTATIPGARAPSSRPILLLGTTDPIFARVEPPRQHLREHLKVQKPEFPVARDRGSSPLEVLVTPARAKNLNCVKPQGWKTRAASGRRHERGQVSLWGLRKL